MADMLEHDDFNTKKENLSNSEKILLEDNPAMFKNNPIGFIICLLLIFFYGIGLIFLIIWYLKTKATKLTITNKRVILRKGLLSKNTNEIYLEDIRNIRTKQKFLQRFFNVGSITIASAATGGIEISISGFKDPEYIKNLIRRNN